MTTTDYFWLKSKTYLKKVPVTTNNTVAGAIVNINYFRQIYLRNTCGQYLLPSWKTDLTFMIMLKFDTFSSSELNSIFRYFLSRSSELFLDINRSLILSHNFSFVSVRLSFHQDLLANIYFHYFLQCPHLFYW